MVRIILAYVWNYCKEGFTRRFHEAWFAAIGGYFAAVHFLFTGLPVQSSLAGEFLAKFMMTCILMAGSTLTALLIKDWYRNSKIRKFIFRKKSDDEKRA